MVYSLKDLVKIEQPTVEVPGNSGKLVTLTVKMPDTEFEGILLGGVTIEPIVDETTKGQVNNIYTHTLAIQVSESEKKVKPNLTFGEVSLDQINYHNVANLTIQNQTPTILTDVIATMTIREKNKSEPLITQVKKGLSIAPNSVFDLPVEWQDLFSPGEYEYNLVIKNNENKWEVTKDFTVSEDEAKKLNDLAVDKKKSSHLWIYICLALLVIVLISVLLILLTKKKGY